MALSRNKVNESNIKVIFIYAQNFEGLLDEFCHVEENVKRGRDVHDFQQHIIVEI